VPPLHPAAADGLWQQLSGSTGAAAIAAGDTAVVAIPPSPDHTDVAYLRRSHAGRIVDIEYWIDNPAKTRDGVHGWGCVVVRDGGTFTAVPHRTPGRRSLCEQATPDASRTDRAAWWVARHRPSRQPAAQIVHDWAQGRPDEATTTRAGPQRRGACPPGGLARTRRHR
jgi:hypothetical protein